jgi:hypothetical protein
MKEVNVPLSIVEFLEELYPPRDFTPDTDIRHLDYFYGQRSVIRFLRAKYDEQNENILTSNPYKD